MPQLDAEIIVEPPSAQLMDPWRELAVERGNAFVTPEWFLAWSRHYGEGQEPRLCAASARDELRGVLPLVLDTGRPRTLRFAGSGLGDFFHPAARPGDEATVAAAAARALRSFDSQPAIVLENVDASASWWRQWSGSGAEPITGRESVLPHVRLAGRSWEDYLASRSRNLRSQVGRKLRALERDHEVRLRWTEREDQVAVDMNTLFRLHDARWEGRPGPSSLASARARAFHYDFAFAAQRRGWLRLCFLELDGEPAAAWYGWRLGGRFAYYQAGFDPDWADRSVGFVLFAQTIRAAAAEGAAEYDMLLGEEAFKARFAESQRRVCTAAFARRWSTARSLARAEARLRRTVRRLPPRLSEPVKRRARALSDRLPMTRRR